VWYEDRACFHPSPALLRLPNKFIGNKAIHTAARSLQNTHMLMCGMRARALKASERGMRPSLPRFALMYMRQEHPIAFTKAKTNLLRDLFVRKIIHGRVQVERCVNDGGILELRNFDSKSHNF
jgi:hypothetical protein